MGNNTLEILITAKDEASAKLSTLSENLEKNRAGLLAVGAASGVAFAGIVAFAKSSIDAANEAAGIQAQLGAVLKSTGQIAGVTAESAIALSKAYQNTTTFSDEAVLSTENLLLTFTKIGKDIFPQATGIVLDMATALGEDTKSAAIQLGKALQDPIQGVNALRRVGVNFSEDQKAVIKQLVDTGHSAEAQAMIMKELTTEFGGSAEAAAKAGSGPFIQLKNQFNELQESVGVALLPALTSLAAAVTPMITKIAAWIEKNPELVKWILLGAAAITGLTTAVIALGLAVPIVTAAFVALSGPIGIVIGVIALLVAAGIALMANWTQIKDFFYWTWEAIKLTFKEAIQALIDYFKPLTDAINAVINLASRIGSSISSGISAVGSFISGKKAQGGSVSGGSTYLVGENGPEYFTPTGGGNITPNGAFGGASMLNFNININGGLITQDVAKNIGDIIIAQFRRTAKI